ILRLRRPAHLDRELLLHLVRLAGQEVARRRDLLEVLLARHVADARRGAMLQIPVETMAVVALARRQRPAAAQMKLPADEIQRVAQRRRMRERPEVPRAIVLLEARERETRDGIVQVHLEHEEPLSSRKLTL